MFDARTRDGVDPSQAEASTPVADDASPKDGAHAAAHEAETRVFEVGSERPGGARASDGSGPTPLLLYS